MRLLSSLLVLALSSGHIHAQQEGNAGSKADQEFIGLLEFLGEFTTEEGEWIDPELVEQSLPIDDDDNGANDGPLTARQPAPGSTGDRQ